MWISGRLWYDGTSTYFLVDSISCISFIIVPIKTQLEDLVFYEYFTSKRNGTQSPSVWNQPALQDPKMLMNEEQ